MPEQTPKVRTSFAEIFKAIPLRVKYLTIFCVFTIIYIIIVAITLTALRYYFFEYYPEILLQFSVPFTLIIYFIILGIIFIPGLFQQGVLPSSLPQSNPIQERLDARKRIEENPEKVGLAWDIALLTLEEYFDRNLEQVKSIYRWNIAVMWVGIIIIVLGIGLAYLKAEFNVVLVTTASGVVTEFIGATFLFLYRSTMNQAGNYVKTLENINTVGMSVQILESVNSIATQDAANRQQFINAKIAIAKQLVKISILDSEELSGVVETEGIPELSNNSSSPG